MIDHEIRACPSSVRLARQEQPAWKLTAVATDPVEIPADVTEMVINRVIDDAAVAAASFARAPVRAAREQALRHPAVTGCPASWRQDSGPRPGASADARPCEYIAYSTFDATVFNFKGLGDSS